MHASIAVSQPSWSQPKAVEQMCLSGVPWATGQPNDAYTYTGLFGFFFVFVRQNLYSLYTCGNFLLEMPDLIFAEDIYVYTGYSININTKKQQIFHTDTFD